MDQNCFKRKFFLSSDSFSNEFSLVKFAERQSVGNVTAGSTVLSTGAIIGIAFVGSLFLFGGLTVAILRCLRYYHKRKNRTRDLDLCDDTEEDIVDPLQSTRPYENGLVSKMSHDQSSVWIDSFPKELVDQRIQVPKPERVKLMPSKYKFEITGVRDSWPLVGLVEPQSALPLSAQRYPIINTGSADKRTSYSALPISIDCELSQPKPTLSKSRSYARSSDGTPNKSLSHSTRSSSTSGKPRSTRSSISDNQLTYILRSTSQRLREAQRRPLSRSLSVMSQVSGASPKVRPLSPPGGQLSESCEALIEADQVSLVDSVHSSVLNSIFQTPNQNKMTTSIVNKIAGKENEACPTPSEIPKSGNLYPSKTPDLAIPNALTSPSKREACSIGRHEIAISSNIIPSTTTYQNERKSLLTIRKTSLTRDVYSTIQCGSADDPFVSAHSKTNSALKPNSVKGPRPLVTQKVAAKQNSTYAGREAVSFPLRATTGNENSPIKSNCSVTKALETQENPFQWSPQYSSSLVLSPHMKSTETRLKRHRRRRTVRLSHPGPQFDVGVVLEEPEYPSKSTHQEDAIEARKLSLVSSEEPIPTPGDSNRDQVSSTRPPSIPTFEPFLAIPSDGEREGTQSSLDGSYSATMLFYDYYSSPDAFRFDQLRVPEPIQSPTLSTKRSRRRAYDFSIDMTHAKDLALLEATPLVLQKERSQSSSITTLDQCPEFVISNNATAEPAGAQLYETLSLPPHTVEDSIATSVSLLRRMNSEVSTYSTRSNLSDHSYGSPTISTHKGDALSLTKRSSEGTVNYLSLGAKKSRPTAKRGGTRISKLVDNHRDSCQIPIHEYNLQNFDALELELPCPKDPRPRSENSGTLIDICDRIDRSLTSSDRPSRSPKWPSPSGRTNAPTTKVQSDSVTTASQENCYSCNKPLSPLRLHPRDSGLASRYHDKCFKCSTCHEPLKTAFCIGKTAYCKQHYYQKVNEICDAADTGCGVDPGRDYLNERWSEIMTTPFKKGVRHESQIEMPWPQGGSPNTVIQWRGSLGLYDEMGFLRSSPDCDHEPGSFELGTMDDLTMGT